ncbi:Upstream activation factor subunit UAF30 [Heracleum sosnowskyi]|uniref:Upstream activation factor subunit UAF30 n=1 Tax=Heracleum sosnowskyi TaxID=360622 RepID=A0AAD8H4G7_9APIA|nr:Upstream activation factor subunit UAF30 [Heracleum sosnowskyi]
MVTEQGGGAAVKMVTEQDIAESVETLLREANPNFTTYTSLHDVVEQLESKLGFNLSHKIDFIRSHIQYLLRPPPQFLHPQPPKDHFALEQHPIFHPALAPPPRTTSQELSFRPPQSQQLQFETYAAAAATTTTTSTSTSAVQGSPAPQSLKKSAQKVKRKRGGPGGLNKLCGVSPLLQPIVGHPTLPRTEIVKQLWIYIRKNNLQDPSNKRKIVCNDELRLVFETDSTDMFKMNKLLAKHIIPLEPTKPTNRVSKKSKANAELENKCDSKCTDVVPIVIISEELASFFATDEREMSQAEALRQIWEYIKVNQLEDPSNAMVILNRIWNPVNWFKKYVFTYRCMMLENIRGSTRRMASCCVLAVRSVQLQDAIVLKRTVNTVVATIVVALMGSNIASAQTQNGAAVLHVVNKFSAAALTLVQLL